MDDISALLNSDIAANPKEEVVNLFNDENIVFKVRGPHDWYGFRERGRGRERQREREREGEGEREN